MNINDVLKKGIQELNNSNIDEPVIKARILLAHILKLQKEYLIIKSEKEIDENKIDEYMECIRKVACGMPLQYITNYKEFMKLKFYVDENVLIPRQDTEVLVEEIIKKCNNKEKEYKILDMCTGSGAIGISIKKYVRNSCVVCADISKNALEIARKNAEINGINNISFIYSNMFDNLGSQEEKFDVIVSNPPYIKKSILEALDEEVKKEPQIALDGGVDGLDFYRIIANNAWKYLKEDGALALEIGYDQKEDVITLIQESRKYTNVYCKKDLAGNDRVIVASIAKEEE